MTTVDLNKLLKQIKILISFHTCAPISEVTSDTRTMVLSEFNHRESSEITRCQQKGRKEGKIGNETKDNRHFKNNELACRGKSG